MDSRQQIIWKIEELKELLKKYEAALEVIELLNEENGVQNQKFSWGRPPKNNANFTELPSISEGQFKILDELQKPMTASMLRQAYEDLTNKTVNKSSFSASLSTNSKIKKIVFPDNPLHTRNWYGLKGWFNGEKLKEEFASKI